MNYLLKHIRAVLFMVLITIMMPSASAHPESVQVQVQLSVYSRKEINSKKHFYPVADFPGRLIIGDNADWQSPTAGVRFRTDAHGKANFKTTGFIDKGWQKHQEDCFDLPGLFIAKDRFFIAVELDQKCPTLFCTELVPLNDHSNEELSTSYYVRAPNGRFSQEVITCAGTLRPATGRVLRPGPSFNELVCLVLRDQSGWTLRLDIEPTSEPIPITNYDRSSTEPYLELDGPYNLKGPKGLYAEGRVQRPASNPSNHEHKN